MEDNGIQLDYNNPSIMVFPIRIMEEVTTKSMKNIPSTPLPQFYGKSHKDPNAFLFEFKVLCKSYDYLKDAHKLKLFPSTLKDTTLR